MGKKVNKKKKQECDPNYGCIKLQSVLSDKKVLCNTIRKIKEYVIEQYVCVHGKNPKYKNIESEFIISKEVQDILLPIIGLLTELEFIVPYNHHSNGGQIYYKDEVKKLLEEEKLDRIIRKDT